MRVRIDGSAFVGKKNFSGVGQYSKLLYEAMSKKHDVDIVTGPFNSTSRVALFLNQIYRKLSSFHSMPYFDIFLKPVDLTLFPNFATWPEMKSKYKIVTIHDLTYLYFPEFIEKKNLSYLKRVIPASIKRADYILTVSETVKDELVKEFNIQSDKCLVTYVPPDMMYYEEQKNNCDLHLKYGTPKNKYILFVGNLEPRKNLSCLIKAYQSLDKKIKSEYKLVIAGNKGWNLDILTDTPLNEDSNNIILTGFVDSLDMPNLYRQAAIFVMPSLYEGFGIPILESMASHTPVITSDIPVLRETGGKAALYFDPKNPTDLGEKIKSLLINKKLQNKLVRLGDDNINRFSWDDNVEKIVNLINLNG